MVKYFWKMSGKCEEKAHLASSDCGKDLIISLYIFSLFPSILSRLPSFSLVSSWQINLFSSSNRKFAEQFYWKNVSLQIVWGKGGKGEVWGVVKFEQKDPDFWGNIIYTVRPIKLWNRNTTSVHRPI